MVMMLKVDIKEFDKLTKFDYSKFSSTLKIEI